MKHDIIKTEKYLLVCDDSEIKENDHVYYPEVDEIWCKKLVVGFNKGYKAVKIIAHLPLNGAPYLDGVPSLPPFEDDVEQLAHEEYPESDWDDSHRSGFKAGYYTARYKYKYTEEDLSKAWTAGAVFRAFGHLEFSFENWFANYKESLQQSTPIAFECEIEPEYKHIGSTKEVKGSGDRIKNKNAGKPKTIINFDGRVEWVGKYIWE
jgi:hypothetical protein